MNEKAPHCGAFCWVGEKASSIHTLGVTPAQAGAHPEIVVVPPGGNGNGHAPCGMFTISIWAPACAGVTPWVGVRSRPYFMKLTRLSWLIMEVAW